MGGCLQIQTCLLFNQYSAAFIFVVSLNNPLHFQKLVDAKFSNLDVNLQEAKLKYPHISHSLNTIIYTIKISLIEVKVIFFTTREQKESNLQQLQFDTLTLSISYHLSQQFT